ncbi:hypothetical protein ACFQGX_03655 [Nonomuraea dietziae]
MPEPRSSTRMPGFSPRSADRSSSSHSGFGPMSRPTRHAGPNREEPG